MIGCGSDESSGPGVVDDNPVPLPSPACAAASGGGSADIAAPELLATLSGTWSESWLGSPAVADLDGDGTAEILVTRDDELVAWHLDGNMAFSGDTSGRIWSPPVVADLLPDRPGLEVAAAARSNIHAWDAEGNELPGFPYEWRDEMRSLAAGDIDGDGQFELVAITTSDLFGNDQVDIMIAVNMDGSTVQGFPPNTTGNSGCDENCFVHAGFDQTLALGDVDGDGVVDILAPQDNAYISLHRGSGEAFDAADIFRNRTKFPGIRMMHDIEHAKQGFAEDEATALQAHFTNSAPAIADIDGDGVGELVVLGSVQNASQDNRELGVSLWVLNEDGTRPTNWETPYYVPEYLAGLNDFSGTNVVGATNQVAVVDLDPERSG
ncbi:MAG: VCBS repeat-containing protein, partial [Myxococcota bacterium]